MSVIPVTVVLSLLLAVTFVVFFLREHARSRLSSAERDSMLPFLDEKPAGGASPLATNTPFPHVRTDQKSND